MRKQREDSKVWETTARHSNRQRGGLRALWLLAVACVLLVPQIRASGETVLPGFRAPLLAEPVVPSTFRNNMSATSTGGLSTSDAEIQELARGLKYSPSLMNKFVREHIKFTPMWGAVKGPYMTWMDRSGNSFDQAALLVALLEEAAEHNTELTISDPCFVVGEVRLTASAFTSWFGVPDDAETANRVLARAGLYGRVVPDGEDISYVYMEHVWVEVTIGGQTYTYDPSRKAHTVEYGIWNLYQVIGIGGQYYNDDTFLSGVTDPNGSLSTSAVGQLLKSHTAELIDHLKTERHDEDLIDVIGGKRIDPDSSVSYNVMYSDDEFDIDSVPDMYRATLRIQHAGIDKTFFSSDIYGRRLTLQYNGSNQPQLVLDGVVQATGTATTPDQAYNLTLSVDHPYGTDDFDETTTIQVVSDGFYQIVNGWADTGTQILRKHRDVLEEHRYDGDADSSEQVLGESYGLVGMTWLAQNSRVRFIAGPLVDTTLVNHHLVGVTGQTESGAPYIDIPLGCIGIISDTNDTDDRRGVFQAMANYASAFEHQVIRQLQDCNAVSTVKLFEMAREEETYDSIFAVTGLGYYTSWEYIQTQLYNYSQAEIEDVNVYADAGYTLYVPECGDLTLDDWTGIGFQALLFDANSMAVSHVIGGGYSGAAADDAALSPATVFENCYGSEQGRRGDGAYGLGSTDLSIGGGGYPYGLSFNRQYSTRRRFEDGSLGLGWTHSLDIQALVKSDSFQFLGMDSPIDAAAQIVSLYIACDLPDQWSHIGLKDMASAQCTAWMMDQITDDVVVIKKGSSTTTFVKDPNGTYNPPPGQKLKLEEVDGNFRMKNSDGIFLNFDGDNRLSQWSDAFGNEVDFTYTSDKLAGVVSKVDDVTCRSLTLSYEGDYISSVTDSAGRSVSYDYDELGQLTTFTNLDSNDVTYEYHETEDGLMTEVFSPIDDVNAVMTIVYDSLGRMQQQTDANDCTWDYYLATYRSEVVEPNQIDPNGVTQRFSTIRWANPEIREVTVTDQMGRETVSEYDGRIRTTSVVSPTGVSSQIEYDENSSVTGVTSAAIPGSGEQNLAMATTYFDHEDPQTGRWFVDVNEATNIVGEVTRYEYDYDANHPSDPNCGRLLKITYPDVNTPSGSETPVVEFTYHADGRIHEKEDPNGMITHYEYYDLTTDPNQGGGLKELVVDANGLDLTASYTYDNVGRRSTVTDPRGNTSQYEYFDSGLLRRTIAPSPFSYETVYEYYDDGKLKHVKTYSGSSSGSSGGSGAACVARYLHEAEGVHLDDQGDNDLTNNGVSVRTYGEMEGDECGHYSQSEGDYQSITDAGLSAGFPGKSGTSNGSFTICGWVKSGFLWSNGNMEVAKKYNAGANQRSFNLRANCVSGVRKFQLVIGYNNGASEDTYLHGSTISTARWYHVGATWDNSTKAYRLRVWDDTAGAILGTDLTGTGSNEMSLTASDFVLGGSWNGEFDDISVFNYALSTSEIDEVRAGTFDYEGTSGGGGGGGESGTGNDFTSDPNCVALWSFENGALTDDTIGLNTLTASSSPDANTSDYQEGAASVDTTGGYFYVTDSNLDSGFPLKNGDTDKDFTVAFWMNAPWGRTISTGGIVYGKGGAYGQYSLAIGFWEPSGAGSGRIRTCIGIYDGTNHDAISSSKVIQRNQWYHVAVTYRDQGTYGSVKIRIYDPNDDSVTETVDSSLESINVEDGDVKVGAYRYSSQRYVGLIDELVVFKDVLSADEIDEVRSGSYGSSLSGGSTSEEVVYLQSITYNNRGQRETVRGPYPEDPTSAELAINYTQYRYDALGRPWQVEDAEGNVTETRYYPDGKVWKVIDANDNDAITKTYNEDGSLQKVADAEGNETEYEYNGFMRLTKTTFEDDTYEELEYDWYQRVEKKTMRGGQEIEFTYDDQGRIESKDVDDPDNPINPSNTIAYEYDIFGRMVTMTDDTGAIAYTYDAAGRITDVNYPGSKIVSYERDAAGNRTKLTYPDSSYITYTYDELSRLTEIRDQASTVLAEYTYDARSRRADLTYVNGTTIAYTYDTASRLLDVNNVTDTGQFKYAYTYDDVGNRLTMDVTDSNGTSAHAYTYDNLYQVTDIDYPTGFDYLATDTTFNYDDVGNRISAIDDEGTVNYTANALNQYTAVADANCTYDDNGNMTFDGMYEYTYDAENRLIRVRNIDPLAAACEVALPVTTGGSAEWFAQTTQCYYDNDAAQSGAIGATQGAWMEMTVQGSGSLTFRYKMDSATGDSLNLFIDEQYQWGATSASGWYSAGPFQISGEVAHTIRWTYAKDGSGSSAGNAYVDYIQWTGDVPDSAEDWGQIEYTYDPYGRRIAKDVDGEVTKYLYDSGHCIAEYDGSNTLLRKTVYGPGVDVPVCMIDVNDSNATYYYHYDALGSVVALSDGDGDTVQVYEYDVYGQVAASDPNHPNPFLFTGRRYDTETGLYYYRARYYNPSIGRFLQTDPIGYSAGMNIYAYCGNSPVLYVDPTGLRKEFKVAFYDSSNPNYTGIPDEGFFDKTFDMKGVVNPIFWVERMLLLLNRANNCDIEITDVYFYDDSESYSKANQRTGVKWLEFGDAQLDVGLERTNTGSLVLAGDLATFFAMLGNTLSRINDHIAYADQATQGAVIHLRHDDSAITKLDLGYYAAASGHQTTGIPGDLDFADENIGRDGPDYEFPGEGVLMAVQGVRPSGTTYWTVAEDPVATDRTVIGEGGELEWYY